MTNKTDRHIAAELLDSTAVNLVHSAHALYLTAHKQREGLSESEYNFLMKLHDRIEQDQQRLSRFVTRLRRA